MTRKFKALSKSFSKRVSVIVPRGTVDPAKLSHIGSKGKWFDEGESIGARGLVTGVTSSHKHVAIGTSVRTSSPPNWSFLLGDIIPLFTTNLYWPMHCQKLIFCFRFYFKILHSKCLIKYSLRQKKKSDGCSSSVQLCPLKRFRWTKRRACEVYI